MGIPYQDQLDAKMEAVRGVFERFGDGLIDPRLVESIAASPAQLGYRNRVKLVPTRRLEEPLGSDFEPPGVALGLYQAESHVVVDIPGCPVQMPGVNRAIEALREGITAHGIRLYNEITHTGDLRFVTVRESSAAGELLVGLVTLREQCDGLEPLADDLLEHGPGVVGVLQNVNPRRGNVIFGGSTRLLAGRSSIEEQVCGVRVRLGLTSFFQINTEVAELAYQAILDGLEVTHRDTLLDLYCGVGTIGLIAARHLDQVVGIEEVGEAVELGRAAVEVNDLANVTFDRALVEERLPACVEPLRAAGGPDMGLLVVVNPPRQGVKAEVIEKLIGAAPRRIAYLSCRPFSLVRDLKRLVAGGYQLESVELFDMFPQTEQVETLAILQWVG
jgi:23S rRNA (uracil1939-C5)-methyltransferase